MKIAKLNKLARRRGIKENYVRKNVVSDHTSLLSFPLPHTSSESPCMLFYEGVYGKYMCLSYLWDSETKSRYIRGYNILNPQEWVVLYFTSPGWSIIHTTSLNTIYYKTQSNTLYEYFDDALQGATVHSNIYQNGFGKVEFSGTCTGIEEDIFNGDDLTYITVPNTVTKIGSTAFANTLLQVLYLASPNITIGSRALSQNTLTHLYLNTEECNFDEDALADCAVDYFFGATASEDHKILYADSKQHDAIKKVTARDIDYIYLTATQIDSGALDKCSITTIDLDVVKLASNSVNPAKTETIYISGRLNETEPFAINYHEPSLLILPATIGDQIAEYTINGEMTVCARGSIDEYQMALKRQVLDYRGFLIAEYDTDNALVLYHAHNNLQFEDDTNIAYSGVYDEDDSYIIVFKEPLITIPSNFIDIQAESISLPYSVKEIATDAFNGSDINELYISSQNLSICSEAFKNSSIRNINFTHSSPKVICKSNAFKNMVTRPQISSNISKFIFENEWASPYSTKSFTDTIIKTPNKEISKYMFSNSGVTTLQITEGNHADTSIADYAFYSSNLEYIYISNNAFQINFGKYAFANTGVTTVYVEYRLAPYLFSGCKNLKTVTISDKNHTDIYEGTFENCSNLTEVHIHNTSSIESRAFAGCKSAVLHFYQASPPAKKSDSFVDVLKIVVPAEYIHTYKKQWPDCAALITPEEDINNTILYTTSDTNPIRLSAELQSNISDHIYEKGVGKIVLNNINTLPKEAFKKTNITAVTLPKSINTIEESAFEDCSELLAVSCLGSTVIKNNAFKGGCRLKTIEWNSNMSLIGDSAFEGCSELKDVNLGDSENVIIGDRAFKGCGSINTIELPENINVGESVFEDCPAIDFKQGDYKIIQSSGKTELLWANSNLSNATIPSHVQVIKSSVFKGSKINKITLPKGLERIDSDAFKDCKYLKSITIPESVKNIGNDIFVGCTSLEKVVFEGYTILKLGMFKGCPNLSIVKHPAQTDEQFISQEITYQNKKFNALIVALSANQIECVIPNNITMIGGSAFIKNKYSKILIPGNVVGLSDSLSTINADIIEFTGAVPTTLGVNYLTNEWFNIFNATKIVVPAAYEQQYKKQFPSAAHLIFNNETADIYNILYTADNPLPVDIINQAFANAAGVVKPNNSTFENNKGTLTFDIQNLPTILTKNAFENVSYLKELVLPENIQVIETKAFYQSGLQKLYAYGVQSIGDSAFADCTNLFNLGFSASLSYCGPDAFKNVGMNYLTYKGTWDRWAQIQFSNIHSVPNCYVLDAIKLPTTPDFTHINNYAFYGWRGESITIPENVISCGDFAFANNNFKIINGIEHIKDCGIGAFSGSVFLEQVSLDNMKIVPERAFENCISLNSVTFSEQVTEINNSAFAGNKQLSDIIIPETISKLGDNAFYNCSKLKNIEIKALTPPIISDSTFLTNSGITNISVPTSVINTYKVAPVWVKYQHQIVDVDTIRYQIKCNPAYSQITNTMEYHGIQYMPSEPPIKNAKLGKELLFIGRAKVPKYNIGSDNTIVSRTSYASWIESTGWIVPSVRSSSISNLNMHMNLEEAFIVYDSYGNEYKSSAEWAFLGAKLVFKLAEPEKYDTTKVYIKNNVLYNYGTHEYIKVKGELYINNEKVLSRFDTDDLYNILYVNCSYPHVLFGGVGANGSGAMWDSINISINPNDVKDSYEVDILDSLYLYNFRESGTPEWPLYDKSTKKLIIGSGSNGFKAGVDPIELFKLDFEYKIEGPSEVTDKLQCVFDKTKRTLKLIFDATTWTEREYTCKLHLQIKTPWTDCSEANTNVTPTIKILKVYQ